MLKKFIYILSTIILGILLSFMVHAIIELLVIWLLVGDIDKYGLGLTWDQLMLVHSIFTFVLFVIGLIGGILFGYRWWKIIYIDKKYRGKFLKIKD